MLPFRWVYVQLLRNWTEAQNYCAKYYDGRLVVMTSDSEHQALMNSYLVPLPGQCKNVKVAHTRLPNVGFRS